MDHVGFIEGRQGANRLVVDLMALGGKRSDLSIILSLDAEKVFDLVQW